MSTNIADFFSTFRISSQGLAAEKQQLAVTAENIANANTTRTLEGDAYKRKEVVREMISRRHLFRNELRNATLQLGTSDQSHFSNSRYTPTGVNKTGSSEIKTEIAESNEVKRVYDPAHPDADEEGYVEFPDINVVSEMVQLIAASRGYEANVTVMNATKSLAKRSLEI